MTACLDDYVEPSPYFGGHLLHYFSCMKVELATECTYELTKKNTLPQVMIKGFNLCEKRNSYFLGTKGLTRDYLPYNSTV